MFLPAADRSAVDRLTHLVDARGAHRALCLVEYRHACVPRQAEESSAMGLSRDVLDHRLVVDRQEMRGGQGSANPAMR